MRKYDIIIIRNIVIIFSNIYKLYSYYDWKKKLLKFSLTKLISIFKTIK